MSQDAIAMIIGRAVVDTDFRKRLIDNAAQACQGYDLSQEELAALEALDTDSLETFAGSLPERLVKGVGRGLIG